MGDKSQVRVNFLGDASALAAASRKAQQALAGVDRQADKASRSLDGAGAAGERSGSKIGSAMRGFGKMFAGFSVAAGGAAIAGGLLGVKTAAGMEQARISFETMLGSAKKADVFLKDLSAFAAKTPFEFPELQTAASSLISAGIEASKVIPIMTTLGDVTSGMGTGSEGVQRATVALQQMSAAGRITGEDLNQLRDAGIPVYDLLASATGKSKAEVVKLAQAGKLGSKELGLMMKALETGAGLERFSGLMDKQSQSLTGLWSTFKDTLGTGLANLIQPAVPKLKQGLAAVSTALSTAFKGISALFTGIGGGGDVLFEGRMREIVILGYRVRDAFDATWPVVKDFAGQVADFARAVGPVLLNVFGRTVELLKDLYGWYTRHKTLVQSVAVAVLAMVAAVKVYRTVVAIATAAQAALNIVMALNPIGIVVLALVGLAAGLVFAYKKSETFRTIVQGAFKAISDAASFMWNSVLKPVFRLWLDTWFTVIGALVNGAASAFGWVPGLGDKLKSAAKKFNEFRDDVNRALDGVKKTVSVRVNAVANLQKAGGAATAVRNDVDFRAHGGPVRSGSPYVVGEEGPELFVPGRSGSIIPNGRTAGGGGGRGGDTFILNVHGLIDDGMLRKIETGFAKLQRERGGRLAFG